MSISVTCRQTGLAFLAGFIMFLSGCGIFSDLEQVDNNALSIPDLVRHFEKCGIKITSVNLLRPDVVHADDGLAIKIDGREIGVYKYNLNIRKQREKLAHVRTNGYIYLVGSKYNVLINGSFMMVGAESNQQFKALETAFMTFK